MLGGIKHAEADIRYVCITQTTLLKWQTEFSSRNFETSPALAIASA